MFPGGPRSRLSEVQSSRQTGLRSLSVLGRWGLTSWVLLKNLPPAINTWEMCLFGGLFLWIKAIKQTQNAIPVTQWIWEGLRGKWFCQIHVLEEGVIGYLGNMHAVGGTASPQESESSFCLCNLSGLPVTQVSLWFHAHSVIQLFSFSSALGRGLLAWRVFCSTGVVFVYSKFSILNNYYICGISAWD